MTAADILTLAEFRQSGRDVEDLAAELPGDVWEGPGRVYRGGLVIEQGRSAAWCLTIGNSSEESDDLDALEEELYQYGICEGLIDEPVSDESRSTGFDPENDADDYYASDEFRYPRRRPMNIAELDQATHRLRANQRNDTPVYVQLPTGEWEPALAARVRQFDGATVLVIYPDLKTRPCAS